MSESIKFRSSVNGFNRNEVISYIENLLKEKEQLLRENELLKAECAARGDEAEAVRKELAEEKILPVKPRQNSAQRCLRQSAFRNRL